MRLAIVLLFFMIMPFLLGWAAWAYTKRNKALTHPRRPRALPEYGSAADYQTALSMARLLERQLNDGWVAPVLTDEMKKEARELVGKFFGDTEDSRNER